MEGEKQAGQIGFSHETLTLLNNNYAESEDTAVKTF